MIKIYDLNQLADYVYDSIRLTDGFSVLNVSHMAYAMKMLIENNCHISPDRFVLETIGGSFMDRSMKNIKMIPNFTRNSLEKAVFLLIGSLFSVTGLRLKHKNARCALALALGDNYLNSNDRFSYIQEQEDGLLMDQSS